MKLFTVALAGVALAWLAPSGSLLGGWRTWKASIADAFACDPHASCQFLELSGYNWKYVDGLYVRNGRCHGAPAYECVDCLNTKSFVKGGPRWLLKTSCEDDSAYMRTSLRDPYPWMVGPSEDEWYSRQWVTSWPGGKDADPYPRIKVECVDEEMCADGALFFRVWTKAVFAFRANRELLAICAVALIFLAGIWCYLVWPYFFRRLSSNNCFIRLLNFFFGIVLLAACYVEVSHVVDIITGDAGYKGSVPVKAMLLATTIGRSWQMLEYGRRLVLAAIFERAPLWSPPGEEIKAAISFFQWTQVCLAMLAVYEVLLLCQRFGFITTLEYLWESFLEFSFFPTKVATGRFSIPAIFGETLIYLCRPSYLNIIFGCCLDLLEPIFSVAFRVLDAPRLHLALAAERKRTARLEHELAALRNVHDLHAALANQITEYTGEGEPLRFAAPATKSTTSTQTEAQASSSQPSASTAVELGLHMTLGACMIKWIDSLMSPNLPSYLIFMLLWMSLLIYLDRRIRSPPVDDVADLAAAARAVGAALLSFFSPGPN